MIKFNPHKSNIVEFVKQIIEDIIFKKGNSEKPIDKIYLEVTLNKNLKFDTISCRKILKFSEIHFLFIFFRPET